METLGRTLRNLREQKDLPLKVVANFLEIDLAILSKIERDQREASRALVIKFADYFKVKEKDLLVNWLSDKLVKEINDEEIALQALEVAEVKVKYKRIQTRKN